MPDATSPGESGNHDNLLSCRNLCLGYPTRGGWKPVVQDVSFGVERGQTTALVGESGSGKSTIAKALVKLVPVKGGSIHIAGTDVTDLDSAAFLPFRKKIQLVFQDPWQALNPRLDAEHLLTEPLVLHCRELDRKAQRDRVVELLDKVHLPAAVMGRYPAELSGGQRQRILLARALAVQPEILVCDEPVSALDVSIQAQLLSLLVELKSSHGLTLLFISHDLAVVQQIADHILVLKEGCLVENRMSGDLFRDPRHEYTRKLIEASPKW